MAKEALKEKFSTGKTPTGEDFAELIDHQGKQGPKGAKGNPGKDAEPQFTEEEVIALKALIEEGA